MNLEISATSVACFRLLTFTTPFAWPKPFGPHFRLVLASEGVQAANARGALCEVDGVLHALYARTNSDRNLFAFAGTLWAARAGVAMATVAARPKATLTILNLIELPPLSRNFPW